MFCENCGASIPEYGRFCPDCGATVVNTIIDCSACGAKVEPGTSFCSNCGNAVASSVQLAYGNPGAGAYHQPPCTPEGSGGFDSETGPPHQGPRKALTWGNLLGEIWTKTWQAVLKALPMSILLFVISMVIHTFLLVGPNGGFAPYGFMGSQLLATKGNIISTTVLWTLLSTFIFSSIARKKQGKPGFLASLPAIPGQMSEFVKNNQKAAPAAILTGAGMALVIAGLMSGTSNMVLAIGVSALFASPLGKLVALLLRSTWNAIWQTLGVKGKQLESHAAIEGYLNMVGTACGFLLGVILIWDSFFGLVILGAAAAMMFSDRDKGKGMPVMPMIIFLIALFHFLGDTGILTGGHVLLADDGGSAEVGGWGNWVGSAGSGRAVAHGVPPAVGAALGPALGNALVNIDPDSYDTGEDDGYDQDYVPEDGPPDAPYDGPGYQSADAPEGEETKYDGEGYDKYGYDREGYDRNGYDRKGYSRWGYDRNGWDREGYDQNGYDHNGYDRNGYDLDGYDHNGYDSNGYHRDGYDDDGYDKNGYDDQGFDRSGYDREGYNHDGYDRNGYDRDGWHRDGYDENGYDKNGFDRDGIDRDGYDKNGYDRDGYDRNGLDRDGYDGDGYNQQGYDRDGIDRDGYNRDGYDRDGFNQDGYDKEGFGRDGYNQDGYDRDGYDQNGYNKDGYDKDGYDSEGYDDKGLGRDGFDREGYDQDGYDQKGVDREGYDRDGYDSNGFDRNGYNRDGFNEQGRDAEGYDHLGYDEEGYDRAGFDSTGYNKDGFDKNGFDKNGLDKDGFNEQGYNKDGYNRSGFNKDGWDSEGYDVIGLDRQGYDRDGLDVHGFTRQENLDKAMDQIIKDRMAEHYYVRNPGLPEKFWNNTLGWVWNEKLGDWKGGQCGEYGEWGAKWVKDSVKEIYGDDVVVESITLERNSNVNHRATLVILPDGERKVLDFWDGMQKGSGQIMDEKDWVKKWNEKLGEPWWGQNEILERPAMQVDLKAYMNQYGDEKGKAAFLRYYEKQGQLGAAQSVLNSYGKEPW
ncbi:hypothetical protein ASZ90_017638 [hydrocarbon metagenome]|uniref:DZANK-type domain-containing protein n=1 Tax=hydrocarbon metagenome TaxID=938273 RepID=A0A0W8E8L2_9ZZZZ